MWCLEFWDHENNRSRSMYLGTGCGHFKLTTFHDAIKFYSKEDAEKCLQSLTTLSINIKAMAKDFKITEHEYMGVL